MGRIVFMAAVRNGAAAEAGWDPARDRVYLVREARPFANLPTEGCRTRAGYRKIKDSGADRFDLNA
jgi:hypothetical protein